VWERVFRVYECSHSGEVCGVAGKVLSYYRVSMYTVIAQTRNINIEPSSMLLKRTSTEKRSYQYNKLSTLLYRYKYFDDLCRSESLYLAYITRVFLTSSPI